MPDNTPTFAALPLQISVACSDRIANHMPLTGSYQSAMIGRLHLCISDLFMCLEQMTEREALIFATDDLLPIYSAFCALQDAALTKGNL